MWSHSEVWQAIDRLADQHGLSVSGLARLAGLDPTSFNPSKRVAADGRPRWPSTESISKVLLALGCERDDILDLLSIPYETGPGQAGLEQLSDTTTSIPVLGMAQAGAGGFFDSAGYPVGHGFDEVDLPGVSDDSFALKVTGDSMLPLYRQGDVVVVSRSTTIKRGDRVVVCTQDGEVMAKVLQRITQNKIELESFNSLHPALELRRHQVNWIARIVWASQ